MVIKRYRANRTVGEMTPEFQIKGTEFVFAWGGLKGIVVPVEVPLEHLMSAFSVPANLMSAFSVPFVNPGLEVITLSGILITLYLVDAKVLLFRLRLPPAVAAAFP